MIEADMMISRRTAPREDVCRELDDSAVFPSLRRLSDHIHDLNKMLSSSCDALRSQSEDATNGQPCSDGDITGLLQVIHGQVECAKRKAALIENNLKG